MALDATAPGRFDIARVIQQTIGVLGRNIVTFSILGVVLVGVPGAIAAFIQGAWLRSNNPLTGAGNFNFSPGYIEGASMGGLVALVTWAILQGTLIYATVQDLNGQKVSVGDCLANGLRNFLPLLGVTILFGIAVVCGMVLLIVPGIMIACAWCVAVPSLVADRTGVFGAFGRSADLTRGSRWQIFALGVLVWILLVIISVVFNIVFGLSTLGADPSRVFEKVSSPLFLITTVIRSTIGAVVGSTAIAVIYVELRRARDGVGPQWLSEIFR